VQILCSSCEKTYRFCRSCWRGHRYCCGACAKLSRLKKQRVHQSKYRKTEKGILAQIRANRKYRLKKDANIVSEHTTQPLTKAGISLFTRSGNCHLCSDRMAKAIILNQEPVEHFSFRRFYQNRKGYNSG